MGYKYKFDNGEVFEFDTEPTAMDLAHVRSTLKTKAPVNDDGPLMQTVKELPERLGSGVSATARTAGSLVGMVPQLGAGLAKAIASPVTGKDIFQIMKESEQWNPMTHFNEWSKPNEFTKQGMETLGEGLDQAQQAGGRLITEGAAALGLAGVSDREQKALLKAEKDPKKRAELEKVFAAQESLNEGVLSNFIPFGGRISGKPFFSKEKNLSSSASKLDALKAELNPEVTGDLPPGVRKTDPATYAAEREAALQADIQRQLSEQGLLPTERTGIERNTPLPIIGENVMNSMETTLKPNDLPVGENVGRMNEPLRPPTMEMDPAQNMGRGQTSVPEGPAPRFPELFTELGAAPFEPKRPAPSAFAGGVEAVRAAREERAGTIDFPGRVEHLTSDPMAQQLLRELDQRKSEIPRMEVEKARGGKQAAEIAEAQRQTEARIAEIEAQLRDNGWTGEPMSGGKGMFGFGKETLAPIQKSGTRDARLSPNAGKAFDPTRNSLGKFKGRKGERGQYTPGVFAEGFRKVYDSTKKGIRYIASGKGDTLNIEAFSRDGDRIGGAAFTPKDLYAKPDMTDLASKMTGVDKDFRKQGVAAEMYKFAASLGNDISPSKARTAEGRAMWDGFEKKGIAENHRIMGPKSQRGSVEGMGNSLLVKAWDRLAKKEEASTFEQKASVEAATKSLPGVSSVYDGITRQGTDPAEVLAKNADFNKDLTNTELKAGTTVTSGANIMAKATKNPFIRSAYEMWDNGTKAALKAIDEHVIPAENAIKALGEQSRIDVAALLRQFEGVGTVSPDTLRRAGYSLPEIKAYQEIRKMSDASLERLNADRVAAGKKPLTAREGFAASTFRGAYKTIVRDSDNKPIYVVAANTKMGHNSLLKAFQEKFGKEFKFETQDPKTFRSFKSREQQADFFYDQFMKDIAAEDPRAQAIQSAFEDWKREHAEYDLGVNQHLKNKSDVAVGGAEGLRFERSASENASAYLEAQLRYGENSFIWSEHQTAFRSTGELMKGLERLPNTQSYLDAYRQNAVGMRQNWAGRVSDAAGLDSYYATKVASWTKASLNSLLLGGPLNLAFMGTQLLQVINTIPEIVSVKKNLSQSQIKALAYDVPKAFVTVFDKWGRNAILGNDPAIKWARDNHVIRPARFEDVGDINVNPALKAASMVWNGPVKFSDLAGRGFAYLAFIDVFKKHFKGEELYRMAADATERGMTDYRDFDSPMMGGSGGQVGKMAMFLHKYPANWINQLVTFGKQKEYAPFVALLGTSFFTAGLTGMIGVGLYDRIADHMGWPSIKEALFKAGAPTWLTMGPLSAWSGVDTQAKTSMADLFPDNPLDALIPGSGFAANAASAAIDPKLTTAAKVHQALPASLKGANEVLSFEKTMPDGSKIAVNPKTEDAGYVRSPNKDYLFGMANESDLRVISARSTKESEWKQKEYVIAKQRAREFKQAEGIITQWKRDSSAADGNTFAQRKATEKLLSAFEAKKLNLVGLEGKLSRAMQEANIPQDVRNYISAQTNPENFIKGQEIRHGR